MVKILDFGIAWQIRWIETATRDYAVGSLPYMAPELLIGKGASPALICMPWGLRCWRSWVERDGIAQDTEDGHLALAEERLAE